MQTQKVKVWVQKPEYGLSFKGKSSSGEEVFLPFTAPGEWWLGEPLKGQTYRPVKPLKKNPLYRRAPFCGHFPLCSNCQWQHIKPKFQTEFKVRLFEEFIGIKPQKVLFSPKETAYRVKTFLYHKGGKLGFRKSWIFDLKMPPLEIDRCPLLVEEINGALSLLRGLSLPPSLHGVEIFSNPQSGETFVKFLFLRNLEIPPSFLEEVKNLPVSGIGIYKGEYLNWERVEVFGKWETTLKVGEYRYTLSPDCFIQPNRHLWEDFFKIVKPQKRYKKIVELHAGIGFFTLPLARVADEIESSDINHESFKYRKKNTSNVGNVKNLLLDAYKHIKRAKSFDLLVVDPPRGGLTQPVVREILKKRPREIIYISCNLKSLSKDLNLLKEGYRIVKAALLDQFPNSYHTESVIFLRKI